jgi:hypothetical protein
MAKVMITSVIRSGQSLAQGETGIQLPDKSETPDGVSQYSAEDEDMLP